MFISALNEFARAVALLGPWVLALAVWPKAAAQNHAVIRTDVMKMAKASGAAAPDLVVIPVASKAGMTAGHSNVPLSIPLDTFAEHKTETHPPHALPASRSNHAAMESFPQDRVSALGFADPQSDLTVTGLSVILFSDVRNSGPTREPVTETDTFVTVNGGMAEDACMIAAVIGDENTCQFGHGPTALPVNTANYAAAIANSLLVKLNQAWDARTADDCSHAAQHYRYSSTHWKCRAAGVWTLTPRPS